MPRWIQARASKTDPNRIAHQHMDGVSSGGSGSGWSAEGLEKYNEIADLIEQDREKRGMVFNQEFLNYVVSRRKHPGVKLVEKKIGVRRKPVPYDDLKKLRKMKAPRHSTATDISAIHESTSSLYMENAPGDISQPVCTGSKVFRNVTPL